MKSRTDAELAHELAEAERQAWEALARYKFMMFGYWAAIWVHLNRIGRFKRPSPWKALVTAARAHLALIAIRSASEPTPAPLLEDAA